MMSIKDSTAFKQEYSKFQQEILEITNETVKRELTALLIQLAREVSSVDMHHDAILITGKMPDGIQDSRNKIASIRKQIDAKLRAYKSNKSNIKPELRSSAK